MIILSPSKGQDFSSPSPTENYTLPDFLDQSQLLIEELRKLDCVSLRELMSISEKIADLNIKRYQDFSVPFHLKNAKQALFAFQGDVYRKIDADHYTSDDLEFAQLHLRILSGLYGCLRPLDLIQPYRLEMKTKLHNPRGQTLYQFWGSRISEQLNQALADEQDPLVINLASNEYFKAVNVQSLSAPVLTINFKEIKNGHIRTVAIFAKRARGLMTDFVIRNRIKKAEDLKKFNVDEYTYSAMDSDKKQWTFTRPQPQ